MNFEHHRSNLQMNLRPETGRDELMFKIEKSKHSKETIFYRLKREWNNLPKYLRKIDQIQTFKSKLKTHFFKQAFPDEHEQLF